MAHVLIVDDDVSIRDILRVVIEGMGHSVALAGDPVGFGNQLHQRRPDLLVLDMQMPAGGGPQVKTMIESRPGLELLPVIFCTGMPLQELKQWFPENPRRRYMAKPVQTELVRRYVAELLPPQPRP